VLTGLTAGRAGDRELGGELTYGARVARVLVEGRRAAGGRLADGAETRLAS